MDREKIHAVVEKEIEDIKKSGFTGQRLIIINCRDGGIGKIQTETRIKKDYN